MIAVAWMTWIEILRKRVLLVTILMTVAFLGVYVFAVHAIAGSSGASGLQQMDLLNNFMHGVVCLTLGLYVSNFTVAYLAIFSSAGTISAEIENGLLFAILPRPVKRWQVYLGKWIGYSCWSLLYGAVMFWSVILIVNMNTSIPLLADSLWKSFGVFELIPLTLVSLSILGSIYLPTLGNGVAVTLLFGIGMIGGFISRIPFSQTAADTMNHIGLVTSLLIPTNALYYRMVSELLGMGNLPVSPRNFSSALGPFAGGPTPSNAFLIYTVLYIGIIIAVGMRVFTRKDV